MGYSFRLAARVVLYASCHRQDNTYHSLCYTSRGALDGKKLVKRDVRNAVKSPYDVRVGKVGEERVQHHLLVVEHRVVQREITLHISNTRVRSSSEKSNVNNKQPALVSGTLKTLWSILHFLSSPAIIHKELFYIFILLINLSLFHITRMLCTIGQDQFHITRVLCTNGTWRISHYHSALY